MGVAVRWLTATAAALGGYVLLVRGGITLDLNIGRRSRPLGPIRIQIQAPRETVFDVVALPYLSKTPRAMKGKLEVLERGTDLVLAAHFTPVAKGLIATTVETVRFERPHRIGFRLVRGPVPLVLETYELRAQDGNTNFEYRGELQTDLWRLGQWWGDGVARSWEAAVRQSLDGIRDEAERRSKSEPFSAPG